MKIFIFLLTTLLLVNCTSGDNKPKEVELVSKWKLTEQLLDPGDGSGVFNSIVSNKTIEFFSNGTVKINGILCYMSSEVGA